MAEKSVFRGMSPDGIRKMAFDLYSYRTELETENEELAGVRKELDKLRAKYAAVYDSAPVGYFTLDRDGVILEVNRTGALQVNVEKDVLVKTPFLQYVARDFQAFRLHWGKVFESGKPETFETRLLRKDNSEFPARIECIPVPDSTGIVTQCRAAVTDIRGHGHAGEERKEHETCRMIFEEADDALFVHDASTGNILDVNRKALELFGYSRDEVMSLSFGALGAEEAPYTEEDALGLMRKAAGGESVAFEWTARDKSGRRFRAEVKLKRVLVNDKDRVTAVMRDITERKEAEEELRKHREHLEQMVEERTAELRRANRELERVVAGYIQSEDSLRKSEEKYRKLMEAANDAIFVTDAESGTVLDVNRKALELAGMPREELVGMHLSLLYPEEGREYYTESLRKAAAEGEAASLKLIFCSRSGRRVPVEVNASVVEIEGRKVLQGIFRDVSGRGNPEEDFPGARKPKSAGLPAGGIAHDFNNALTAMLNNIYLAKSFLTPDSKAYERLGAAETASLKARRLTEQLLAPSKDGAPRRETTSLQGMIEETVELVLCGATAVCDYSIPEDLWPVEIDEAEISRVISTLVIDADQAVPEDGAIRVSAENTFLKEGEVPPLMEGWYVRVDVEERGRGTAGKSKGRMLGPSSTANDKSEGLAGSYAIVRNHGGHITAEPGQEGGSVFHVYLPAVPEGRGA